jgi:thiol-disulfide isomerase/thioredoxin
MHSRLILLLLVISTSLFSQVKNDGHQIKVKINGLAAKDTVYLANYYGPKIYYKDTTTIDAKGYAVFQGKDLLPGGIYAIVLPDKATYFEIVVTEPKFTIETDKSSLIKSLKVTGSEENKIFYEYLNFINDKQTVASPFRATLNDSLASESAKKDAREKLMVIDKEVKEYKHKFMADHPNAFITKVFKTSEEPELPAGSKVYDEELKDSVPAYEYYKNHFWDDVDFSDERLIRTPVYVNKLEKYMTKVILQIPDTINKEADWIIEKVKNTRELFKYTVHYVTNTFETSQIMGMDAVFVHMAKNYYKKDLAFWVDSAQLEKITERARKLDPLLMGKIVPNVILQDTSETKWYSLYDVKSPYTILYFWDSGCGHCKKATPKLKEFYEKYHSKGIEVFAVGTEFENDKWKAYIIENQLPFINVSDNPEINKNAVKYLSFTTLESLNFRQTFDIYSTPVVYVLNNKKEIIAKKLGVEQLEEFFEKIWEREKEKNKLK